MLRRPYPSCSISLGSSHNSIIPDYLWTNNKPLRQCLCFTSPLTWQPWHLPNSNFTDLQLKRKSIVFQSVELEGRCPAMRHVKSSYRLPRLLEHAAPFEGFASNQGLTRRKSTKNIWHYNIEYWQEECLPTSLVPRLMIGNLLAPPQGLYRSSHRFSSVDLLMM